MPTFDEAFVALTQTRALIDREPTEVVLQRPADLVSDGAGGFLTGEGFTDMPKQTVFVSAVTRDSDYRQSSFIQNSDGEKYVNHIIIIGMPEFDVKKGDEFDYLGTRIKITFVHPETRWERKCEGDRVVSGDG